MRADLHDFVHFAVIDFGISMNNKIAKSNHALVILRICLWDDVMFRQRVDGFAKAARRSPLLVGDDMIGKIDATLNRVLEIQHDDILRIRII